MTKTKTKDEDDDEDVSHDLSSCMLHPTLCPSSSACTFGHRFQLDTHQHPVRILSVATLIPVGYPRGAVAVADSVTGGASLRLLLHSLLLCFRYAYGKKRRCVCEHALSSVFYSAISVISTLLVCVIQAKKLSAS